MRKLSYSGFCKILAVAILLMMLPIAFAQPYSDEDLESEDFNWEQVNVNELTDAQIDTYWARIPEAKKDEYFSGAEAFTRIINHPDQADDYFSNAQNVLQNRDAAEFYFKTKTKGRQGASFTISEGSALLSYSPETNRLSNGETTIRLAQYGTGDIIETIPGGGFRINGVKVGGGEVKKTLNSYTLTNEQGDSYNFIIPQSPEAVKPTAVEFTEEGFSTEGPVPESTVTVAGMTITFESRSGRFAVLNDGTVAADNARATFSQRLYDGRFVAKGDETSLLPMLNGEQSRFYDFGSASDISVRTNGGDVQIHSNQLPSDAQSTQNPGQPLTLDEAEQRAQAAEPVQPMRGEVWYKGSTVIAKGFAEVSGRDGIETFNFLGNGQEADFYRGRDSNNPENTVTSAVGRFELGISGRITADSTIYEGDNPEQILFLAYSTENADAVTVDAPNDGLDAMKISRNTDAYERIGAGLEGVSIERGEQPFEMIISKSNNDINIRMAEETMSFLGEVKENPANFIVLSGGKDFLLSDTKPEEDESKTYLALTKEGGLVESSGNYLNILGPENVQEALGDETILTPEEGEAVRSFFEQAATTNPQELAQVDLSDIDQETLDRVVSDDPGAKMLVNCIQDNPSCTNREEFFDAYTRLNEHAGEGSVDEFQAYFDLSIASGVTPEEELTAALVNEYINQGDFEKANEIKRKSDNRNIHLYVDARMNINDLIKKTENAQERLNTEYKDKWEVEDGELIYHTEDEQEIAEINSLFQEAGSSSDKEMMAKNIVRLSKVDEGSAVYDEAQQMVRGMERNLLTEMYNNARLQSAESVTTFQETYSLTSGFATAATNLINFGSREKVQEFVANELNAQSLGFQILLKSSEQGISVNDISQMSSTEKIEWVKQVYPNAKPENLGYLVYGLDSALENPDVQALADLEKGYDVNAVKTTIDQGWFSSPTRVVFPGIQAGTGYSEDAEMLEQTYGETLGGVALMVATAPVTAKIGAAGLAASGGRVAPFLTANFPRLAALGSRAYAAHPTLTTVGLETAGALVVEAGLPALGVNSAFAAIASNFVAINPASRLASQLRKGKTVQRLVKGQMKTFSVDDMTRAGTVILRDEAGETVELGLKQLVTDVGTGSARFTDNALQRSARKAASAEKSSVDDLLARQRDDFFDSMDSARVDGTELARINEKYKTNLVVDAQGSVVGTADDFDTVGASLGRQVECPT